MNNQDISVRELKMIDLDLLANYWYEADSAYLRSMGADQSKLPARDRMIKALAEQVNLSIVDKKSYALIWELDGKQIGHSNVNNLTFGEEGTMHLHLWRADKRKRGMGAKLVQKSLVFYFEKLQLNKLICEPYALNIAPNKTLEKVGFTFIKKYTTTPGSINFEQEVKRWELTKEKYEKLKH